MHGLWHTPKLFYGFIVSSKVKTIKREKVGALSLTHNTSEVEGCVGALGWGIGRLTSNLVIHTDMHKPNNKLFNA